MFAACAKESAPPPVEAPKVVEPIAEKTPEPAAKMEMAADTTQPAQFSPPPVLAPGAKVAKVEQRNLVCNVNNSFMGKVQIPVEIEGRTYFGCCAMCKARLEQNVTLRMSTDPVTGKSVDKANAVIGMKATGDVVYFESDKTLEQYNKA